MNENTPDTDYEAFQKLRAEGKFASYDRSWFAVIQFGAFIQVVKSPEDLDTSKLPPGEILIQPITDSKAYSVPTPVYVEDEHSAIDFGTE